MSKEKAFRKEGLTERVSVLTRSIYYCATPDVFGPSSSAWMTPRRSVRARSRTCVAMPTWILYRARVRSTVALMFGRSSNGSVPRHVIACVGLPDLLSTSLHLRPPCSLSGCDSPTTRC